MDLKATRVHVLRERDVVPEELVAAPHHVGREQRVTIPPADRNLEELPKLPKLHGDGVLQPADAGARPKHASRLEDEMLRDRPLTFIAETRRPK